MSAERLVLDRQIPPWFSRAESLVFVLAFSGLVFSSVTPALKFSLLALLVMLHGFSHLHRLNARRAKSEIEIEVSQLSAQWCCAWACLVNYQNSTHESPQVALLFASCNSADNWRQLQVHLKTRSGQAVEPSILC